MTETNDHAEIARLREALLSIVTDGDAMSGEECQQIAAEALQIPVPPPVIPRRKAPTPELPAPYAHNAPSQADIENDGAVAYPPDMPRHLWR